MRLAQRLLPLLLPVLLSACGTPENEQAVSRVPQPFADGDECHVCGMAITRFPGPKGEAFVHRSAQPLKFCSTRDLFAWLLQPETAAIVEAVYVHDMTGNDWDRPDDARLIDARSAWYVVGHELRGAMGPTLAAFGRRADAETFAARHGGRVLAYEEIDLQVLASMLD